jgi:hypothetical protein
MKKMKKKKFADFLIFGILLIFYNFFFFGELNKFFYNFSQNDKILIIKINYFRPDFIELMFNQVLGIYWIEFRKKQHPLQ